MSLHTALVKVDEENINHTTSRNGTKVKFIPDNDIFNKYRFIKA